MQLDNHGRVAAATVAFYAPVAIVAVFLALKHGFSKTVGWFFLVALSIRKCFFNPQTRKANG